MVDEEYRDELPDDLDITGLVGPYTFPDVRRRRWPGAVYLLVGAACVAVVSARGSEAVLVNGGVALAGAALVAIGLYHMVAGWPLAVRETDALVAASRRVGFPIGHASAQVGFRGLLSRPTWRLLLYSAENPPAKRGMVLVDGVDGEILGEYVEDNPEDWSQYDR